MNDHSAGEGARSVDDGNRDVDEVLDVDALPGGARAAIEAVLMIAEDPISDIHLASTMGLTIERVRRELQELVADYAGASRGPVRGFQLREVAGGWRMYSRPEHAPVVEKFVIDGQTAKLTQAALETLAIVAYRQPVTRGQASAIRGVNVDGVVRTLIARDLIEEVGTDPHSGAVLYGTSPLFLERLGLKSTEDLPPLSPYLPEDAFDSSSLESIDSDALRTDTGEN